MKVKIRCDDCGYMVPAEMDEDGQGFTLTVHEEAANIPCTSTDRWVPKDQVTEIAFDGSDAPEPTEPTDPPEGPKEPSPSPALLAFRKSLNDLAEQGELSHEAAEALSLGMGELDAKVTELTGNLDPRFLVERIAPALDKLMGASFKELDKNPPWMQKHSPIVDGLSEMQADISEFAPLEDVTLRGADDVNEFIAQLPDYILEKELEERGKYNTPLVIDLQRLLNRHSAENSSNTPDYVLAEYMMGCLEAFNKGVLARAVYYGDDQHVGGK